MQGLLELLSSVQHARREGLPRDGAADREDLADCRILDRDEDRLELLKTSHGLMKGCGWKSCVVSPSVGSAILL